MQISIALATYNGEKFLEEQLDSILDQTYLPYEIVICDDGSTDATDVILNHFKSKAPFSSIILKNRENKGTAYSFKKAIDLCKGEIIAFCDQDDVWLPNKLEKINRAFENTPNIDYIISDANIVDENLNFLGYTLWEQRKFSESWQKKFEKTSALQVIIDRNITTGMATAISNKLRDIGQQKPENVNHDSWYIALAALHSFSGVLIKESLVNYRQHANQQFGGLKRRNNFLLKNTFSYNYNSIIININNLKPLVDYVNKSLDSEKNSKYKKLGCKLEHFYMRKLMAESNMAARVGLIIKEIMNFRYFISGSYKTILLDLLQ